jgi:hypothetical protein
MASYVGERLQFSIRRADRDNHFAKLRRPDLKESQPYQARLVMDSEIKNETTAALERFC